MESDTDRDDENEIGPDLTALERRLSAWRPAAVAIDRDRLLYDAGRAAAEGSGRPWRLATAALLLVSMGLGAALIHQRSMLAGARILLARERSQRLWLETATAGRAAPPAPAPAALAASGAIEPPSPSSYLALSARIAEGLDDLTPRGSGTDPAASRSAPDPANDAGRPDPLRPQDIRRVLDL
jgi:hypothetical protein